MNEVTNGLKRLLPLALDYSPAPDMLRGTALAWVDALDFHSKSWDEEADAWRFQQAFRWLGANMTAWPKPIQFIQALPPRRPVPELARPVVPMTAEQLETQRRNRELAQEAVDALAARFGMKLEPLRKR
jgi:hypothetical protein